MLSYLPATHFLFGLDSQCLLIHSLSEPFCLHLPLTFPFLACEPCYCLLTPVTALCLGGYPASASAIVFNLLVLTAVPVADLQFKRELPGVCHHSQSAYVFGGFSVQQLTSCEKLDLKTETWSRLPDMRRARCAFPPCVAGEDVYLPCTSSFLEVFNVVREEFRVVQVSADFLARQSVSFVIEGDLVVVTSDNKVNRLSLASPTQFAVAAVECPLQEFALSMCVPVLVGRECCWVSRNGGQLVRFNNDTTAILLA